ncbi:MAG: RNA polymerase sigma factor [Opitutaceae bacterium]|nr:RNA polymerase sigma factor [Opitutaceae bacterium]
MSTDSSSNPVEIEVPAGAGFLGEDQRWFAQKILPHAGQLRAYLRNTFPGVRDVDDIMQESYLRVWRTRGDQSIQSPKAFLFRVARNLALDILRRGRRSPVETKETLADLPVLDRARNGVEQLGDSEQLGHLAEAVASLSPRSRELIVLCQIQGLTHREAALRLGLSLKTVDEHILRGLRRLGQELRRRGFNGLNGS